MKKPRTQKSFEIAEHIDTTKKVRVYRNLHRDCYSVKQGGIVRCHAENVTLRSCQFIVSKAGQRRVRDEKRKNVHAFIEGYVFDTRTTEKRLTVISLISKSRTVKRDGNKSTTTHTPVIPSSGGTTQAQ